VLTVPACESTSVAPPAVFGASPDSSVVQVMPNARSADITSIAVSPLTLVPSFAPSVHDYAIPCNAGNNLVTVMVTSSTGTQATEVDVAPNDAIVVAETYWIRCLPPDFPEIAAVPHGAGPTPGYYLVNDQTYAMVLDTNGTPVWYSHGTVVIDLDSQLPNVLSFSPNSSMAGFGTSPLTFFEVRTLATDTITTVQAVGLPVDGHELRMLSNGDFLVFAYPIISHVDLSALGYGSDANLANCEIQEVDPRGNLVCRPQPRIARAPRQHAERRERGRCVPLQRHRRR
jgi:hypothetical protein